MALMGKAGDINRCGFGRSSTLFVAPLRKLHARHQKNSNHNLILCIAGGEQHVKLVVLVRLRFFFRVSGPVKPILIER